jgi:hypothetical protein
VGKLPRFGGVEQDVPEDLVDRIDDAVDVHVSGLDLHQGAAGDEVGVRLLGHQFHRTQDRRQASQLDSGVPLVGREQVVDERKGGSERAALERPFQVAGQCALAERLVGAAKLVQDVLVVRQIPGGPHQSIGGSIRDGVVAVPIG